MKAGARPAFIACWGMPLALCGGTRLDGDGRGRNDGGAGVWTRISAAKVRATRGDGCAGRQVGADLLYVSIGRVGSDQGNADVVDQVVTRGGDEEELVVRGEGAGQGCSNAGCRAPCERDITHGLGT